MMANAGATRRRLTAAAAGLVLAAGLAGCGEESGSEATEEPTSQGSSTDEPTTAEPSTSESAEPAVLCDEVWVAGQPLPEKYRGCQDGDRWVEAFVYHCSSGQRLITFGRHFYAAKGGSVVETATPLARDPDFKRLMATCGA